MRTPGTHFHHTPKALFSTLIDTSGTITHRMKSLETRGLVQRLPNPQDARSMLVQLTDQGLELIDRAVEAHLDNERAMLAPMPVAELAALDQRLSQLLRVLEGGPDEDRKSTRLNSSHLVISYAVFCL